MNEYDIGDAVQFGANFKNSAGADADPTTVLFKMKDPSGNIATYTYGGTSSNTALVRDNVGDFHIDQVFDEAGIWHYRFSGSGVVTAAEEEQVLVRGLCILEVRMPKKLERKLRKEAEELFDRIKNPQVREDRIDRYIYGTMRRLGWKPKRER